MIATQRPIVKPWLSASAVWAMIIMTIIAHGCHTGGHEIDVEPMIMIQGDEPCDSKPN